MMLRLFDFFYYNLSTFDIAVKREGGYAIVETNYFWFGHTFKVELVNGVFYTDSMDEAIAMANKMGKVVEGKYGAALDLVEVDGLAFRRALRKIAVYTTATMLVLGAIAIMVKGVCP
jgi:hypothetical protein